MNWITAHWEAISLGLWLLINIVNAASRHYSNHTGLAKALLFITEVLSIIRSRDQAPGAVLGNAKLPLDLPKSGARGLIPFALVVSVFASGCCETPRCYLARCQTALGAADPLVIVGIEKACESRVATCKPPVEQCAEYQKCKNAAIAYRAARNTIGTALADVNVLLEQMGVP